MFITCRILGSTLDPRIRDEMLPAFLKCLLFVSSLIMRARADIPIRIVSHNIRYATTSPFVGTFSVPMHCLVS